MKIATWNVERLKHKARLELIEAECKRVSADIFVLTETDTRVKPNYKHCFQTSALSNYEAVSYNDTERRVSIFTDYECVNLHPTYDEQTSVCAELETENGRLLIYGTIIGIYGNRHPSFDVDLAKQLTDFKRLSERNPTCASSAISTALLLIIITTPSPAETRYFNLSPITVWSC